MRDQELEAKGRPAVYEPAAQVPFNAMYFGIRAAGDPAALIAGVRAAMRELDAELPLDGVGTVDALVATSLSQRRFAMLLMAIFAGLALVLAMVGIYGVISYSVTQATQEIGIRMALGARRGDVLEMVFGYAGVLMAAGLVIGASAALGTGRYLASQLFEVQADGPRDLCRRGRRPAGDRPRCLRDSCVSRDARRPAGRVTQRVACRPGYAPAPTWTAGAQPRPFTASWYLETACRPESELFQHLLEQCRHHQPEFQFEDRLVLQQPRTAGHRHVLGLSTRQALRSWSSVRRIRPAVVSDTSAVRL